jgi:spore coat polysaccharide biosynthesis protein SpsF
MKVVAVIQARMGSTRFPGKVAEQLIDQSLLEHLIKRLQKSKLIDEIVVATTKAEIDQKVVSIAQSCGVLWFQGSEKNVLERIIQAAQRAKANIVVRVTSDNPLTDPFIIDSMIEKHVKNQMDYTWVEGMPIGTTAEVISLDSLEKERRLVNDPYDLEHVTTFIRRNPGLFKIQFLPSPPELRRSSYRLTVDYKKDFILITKIFQQLYKPGEYLSLNLVVDLLDNDPALRRMSESEVEQSE